MRKHQSGMLKSESAALIGLAQSTYVQRGALMGDGRQDDLAKPLATGEEADDSDGEMVALPAENEDNIEFDEKSVGSNPYIGPDGSKITAMPNLKQKRGRGMTGRAATRAQNPLISHSQSEANMYSTGNLSHSQSVRGRAEYGGFEIIERGSIMQTDGDFGQSELLTQSMRGPNNMNQSCDSARSHAAKWVPDTMNKNCEICNAKFSKFFKRRHHCRQCGGVVCHPCSNVADYVFGYQDKKVRICTLCNVKNVDQKKIVQNAKKNMVMSATTIKNVPPKKK